MSSAEPLNPTVSTDWLNCHSKTSEDRGTTSVLKNGWSKCKVGNVTEYPLAVRETTHRSSSGRKKERIYEESRFFQPSPEIVRTSFSGVADFNERKVCGAGGTAESSTSGSSVSGTVSRERLQLH
jgi:hypothetical protein